MYNVWETHDCGGESRASEGANLLVAVSAGSWKWRGLKAMDWEEDSKTAPKSGSAKKRQDQKR
jgi:hypothetical protein